MKLTRMGEVRARVFELLACQNGQLEPERVRVYDADAVIDTGSVPTVLPIHVVHRLGLKVITENLAEDADGRKEVVGVAQPVEVNLPGRSTVIQPCVLGDEVLIGQTVLEMLDLLADCANRRVIPNTPPPGQPLQKIR
ncbi:MAG: clan AA aspartic protease [Candidatus Eremiobacterota bacterium]